MPYANLDDKLWCHPKTDHLHGDAFELWVCSISFCADRMTDGHLTESEARRLAAFRGISWSIVDSLVACPSPDEGPFWEIVPNGFIVHNYIPRNRTRAKIMTDLAENARRQNDWRKRQDERIIKEERNESHNSLRDRPSNTVINGVENTAPVPYPVPVPVPSPRKNVALTAAAEAPSGANKQTPRKERAPTENDQFWEAFVTAIGTRPVGRAELAKWGSGVSTIRQAGVAIEEIPAIVDNYHRRCPSMPCNPAAIANHLSDYRGSRTPTNGSRAVDRSDLAGGVDYVALYNAKQERERKERDASSQLNPTG